MPLNSKETACVGRCLFVHFLHGTIDALSYLLEEARHVGGLIAFAAFPLWWEEGAVGFNVDAIDGGGLAAGAKLGVLGIGQRTGEGDVEAKREGSCKVVSVTGKTVHDSANAVGFVLELSEERVLGVSAVEDEREVEAPGPFNVTGESGCLLIGRGAIAKEIETRFPHSDEGTGFEKGLHFQPRVVGLFCRAVGVNACCWVHEVVGRGQIAGGYRRYDVDSYNDMGFDSRCLGTLQSIVAIVVKAIKKQM